MYYIKLFLVSIFLWFCVVRATIIMQKDTKHNEFFYPKHYTNPPKRIRRIFHVKEKMIPKYLYYRMLYMGFGFIPLSITWIILLIVFDYNDHIRYWVYMSYWYILLCESIVFVILSSLFQYLQSKEQRQRMRQIKQKQRAERAKRKNNKT